MVTVCGFQWDLLRSRDMVRVCPFISAMGAAANAGGAATFSAEAVRADLCQMVGECTGVDGVTAEDSFLDVGLDSLGTTELVALVQSHFNVRFNSLLLLLSNR